MITPISLIQQKTHFTYGKVRHITKMNVRTGNWNDGIGTVIECHPQGWPYSNVHVTD